MPPQNSVFGQPSGSGRRGGGSGTSAFPEAYGADPGPGGAFPSGYGADCGSDGGGRHKAGRREARRGDPGRNGGSGRNGGRDARTGAHSAVGDGDGPRRRRGFKQRVVLGALSALVVVCMGGIAVAAWGIHTLGRIERVSDVALDPVVAGDPVNYLLIGSDARSSQNEGVAGQRADSIVLFRVDPEAQQAAILTVPRDLLLPLADDGEFDPGSQPQKVNGAYNGANGRDDLAMTIRENFGIPIHHFVEINFEGFERLIDSVGGVDIFVDQAIHDPRSGLLIEELGCVNLDGATALQFVRSRHLETMGANGWESFDPTADLGRGTRQQEFIRQAVGKALREAPTNPNQLRQVVESVADTIALDEGLSISNMVDLARSFRNLDAGDPSAFQTLQLPVVDEGTGTAGDPYQLWLQEREAEPVLNVFRGLDPGEISPRLIDLTVLNGTGGEDEALNVGGAFQDVGFNLVEIGDIDPAEQPRPRTTVYHAPGEENLGMRVARHVTGGVVVQERADIASGDVELVTGEDLEAIHEVPTPVEEMPDTSPPAGEGEAGGQDATEGGAVGGGGADEAPAEPAEGAGGGGETSGQGGGGSSPPPTQESYGHEVGGGETCT